MPCTNVVTKSNSNSNNVYIIGNTGAHVQLYPELRFLLRFRILVLNFKFVWLRLQILYSSFIRNIYTEKSAIVP